MFYYHLEVFSLIMALIFNFNTEIIFSLIINRILGYILIYNFILSTP